MKTYAGNAARDEMDVFGGQWNDRPDLGGGKPQGKKYFFDFYNKNDDKRSELCILQWKFLSIRWWKWCKL
jgi:hypothetical protein